MNQFVTFDRNGGNHHLVDRQVFHCVLPRAIKWRIWVTLSVVRKVQKGYGGVETPLCERRTIVTVRSGKIVRQLTCGSMFHDASQTLIIWFGCSQVICRFLIGAAETP